MNEGRLSRNSGFSCRLPIQKKPQENLRERNGKSENNIINVEGPDNKAGVPGYVLPVRTPVPYYVQAVRYESGTVSKDHTQDSKEVGDKVCRSKWSDERS